MVLTDDYYRQSDWGQNYASRANVSWGARIDYGFGNVETIELPPDVGSNPYNIEVVRNKSHAYEQRTGRRPNVEYFKINRTLERAEQAVELVTKALAWATVGSSLAAGFLDRYRLTLAARIDGLRSAIGVLTDLTKPCVVQLPKAMEDLQKAGQLVSKIKAAMQTVEAAGQRLPLAAVALKDAETAKQGLEVCANLASEFTKIVEPMERVNEAMAGQGLVTKAKEFVLNADMATVREAWNTYSIGEQSLGFMVRTASAVSVGLAVRSSVISVCTNVLNVTESKAKLAGNISGIAVGLVMGVQGSLLQTAAVGLCAVGTNYAIKTVGAGVRTLRDLTGI
jgi:hypothetical protein